jgi:hypothetical protein
METDWCGACGGEGHIDEEQAARLGVDLGDARTGMCPVCDGTGFDLRLSWRDVVRLLPLGIAAWSFFIGLIWGLWHAWKAFAG